MRKPSGGPAVAPEIEVGPWDSCLEAQIPHRARRDLDKRRRGRRGASSRRTGEAASPAMALRTLIRISVPSGTRTSGPGICGALPSSANVWTTRVGSLGALALGLPAREGGDQLQRQHAVLELAGRHAVVVGDRRWPTAQAACRGATGWATLAPDGRAPGPASPMRGGSDVRTSSCGCLPRRRRLRWHLQRRPFLAAMAGRAVHRRVRAVQGGDVLQVLVVDGRDHRTHGAGGFFGAFFVGFPFARRRGSGCRSRPATGRTQTP